MESQLPSASLETPEHAYSYQPRMMGAVNSFQLTPKSLLWNLGRQAGEVAYSDIVQIRLSFQPSNFAGSRFMTEIWVREGGKLLIASVSARSLFDFENRGPAYRAFVIELCKRVLASNPNCRFESGFPTWRWWPVALVGLVASFAALYLIVRVLLEGSPTVGFVLLFFGLFFGWQIGSMVVRNRPLTFVPPELPRNAMPSI